MEGKKGRLIMNIRLVAVFFGFLAMLALSGCGDNAVRRSLGLLRSGPDAFAVKPNRPIEIPESNELPLPQPGVMARVEEDPMESAREALGASAPESGGPGRTELNLLETLGALESDPGIRQLVNAEHQVYLDGEVLLVHKLLGVEQRRYSRENALDPVAEIRRLRELGIVARPSGAGAAGNGS
jgi:hypothetical protein